VYNWLNKNIKQESMMKELVEVKKIDLANTKDGQITVSVVHEPYGEESLAVASVAINLSSEGKEPDWKVHIPKENIDAVCEALQKAKEDL
jgi:hypothetical protein